MALSTLSDFATVLGVKPEGYLTRQYNSLLKLLALMPTKLINQQVATWSPDFSDGGGLAFSDGYKIQDAEFSSPNFKLAMQGLAQYRKPYFVPSQANDAAPNGSLDDLFEEIFKISGNAIFKSISTDLFTGTVAGGPTGLTLVGIDPALAVSGIYGGIDKGSNPDWRGNVITGVGALTKDKLRDAVQAQKDKSAFVNSHVFVGSPKTCGAISKLGDGEVQHIKTDGESLMLNAARLMVMDVPVVEMYGVPDGKLYLLDLNVWELQILPHKRLKSDFMFMTKPMNMRAGDYVVETASIPLHVRGLDTVDGKSGTYAVVTPSMQLVCKSPRANTVLTGITY